MATTVNSARPAARPISNLRWWIGGLLFASTVINYLDRQTLSVLAPYLKRQYEWNNQNFAEIVIAFRVAYSVGQTLAGRLIDRIGTRKGLTITVIWYSIAAMLTSLAGGLRSFAFFRFLLAQVNPKIGLPRPRPSQNGFLKRNVVGLWRCLIVALQSVERSHQYS